MAVVSSNKFDFTETVQAYLAKYSAGATEVLEEAIKEVSKEAVKKLKSTSPRRTGDYKKSWAQQPETGRLKVGAVVYARKPEYRLTHLLEKGHAKRGGGRVEDGDRVKAIEHIKPVNDWAQEEAIDRFIQKMENWTR